MQQQEKALAFKTFHQKEQPLILPNIWDSMGALLLQELGYEAVATSSSAMALSQGYADGQKMPFELVQQLVERIAHSVDLPVSVDIENGYAENDEQLVANIQRIIQSGVVGINYEDSDKLNHELIPIDQQAKRIRLIRQTAEEMGVSLFINARIDVFLPSSALTRQQQKKEALLRGNAYIDAGADGLFPILLKDHSTIEMLCQHFPIPINIMKIAGSASIQDLIDMGVKRISLGGGFMKLAIERLKTVASELKEGKGWDAIDNNTLNPDYVDGLVKRVRY